MAINITHQNNGIFHLVIQGEMNIYTVLEQKQQLLDSLTSASQLQIDLSAVTELDGAGLQLLMFLKQETDSRQINLTLVKHSQAIVEVFELLNLSKHFGDPIVLQANWVAS